MEQKNIQVEVQGKNVLPTPIKNLRELTTEVTQAGADATVAKALAEVNTEIVADKDYDTAKFSGMGRVNLQKNIVDGHNYLTQEMVSKPNTIYKIQYDYEIAPVTTGYIAELNQGVIEVEGHNFNYKVIAVNVGDIITKESGMGNTTAILYQTADNVWHNPHTPVLTVEDGWTIAIADVVGGSTAVNYNVTTKSITVPENCVLEFEGGSISGGTLVGNGTRIEAGDYQIFKKGIYRYRGYKDKSTDTTSKVAIRVTGDNVYINGSWSNEMVSPSWVGLDKISSTEDSAPIIMDYITLHRNGIKVRLPQKTYGIYGQIAVHDRTFDGNNSIFLHCNLSDMYDATIPIPTGTVALDSEEFPKGLPLMYQNIYIQGAGELCNFTMDQSNITTSDIKLNHWGIYGLIGQRGSQKNIIRNIIIKNAYECGFIGLKTSIECINCTFDGSGEHEFYGRPNNGEIIFRDCTFKNWENIQEIAEARGAAFAMKIVPSPERVDDCVIRIIGCKFYKGDSYSNYALKINADKIEIENSKTDIEWASFAGDSQENKVKHLYITGCEGIFYDYRAINFIIHVINSKGTSKVLQTAYEVSNCSLNIENSENINARDTAQEQIAAFARKLIINNTVFISNATTKTIVIVGAYEINITNCNVITYGDALLEDTFSLTIKTNVDDVEIEEVTPTLYICNSIFLLGKRKKTFLYSKNYLVTFVEATFRGGKYYPSGYLNTLRIVDSCKQLIINNTKVIPASDGTVLNLYGPTVTDVSFVSSTPVSGNPESNIGMQSFNYVNKKPIWWNGSTWVDAIGIATGVQRAGLITKRPALADIYAGFMYLVTQPWEDATLGTDGPAGPYYFDGSNSWILADGTSIQDSQMPARS